ncbi:hypothetical protein ACFY03_17550 [Micromonospora chersina]|uniref:hypothetical protein n=1 Tax=Micromonospora chersina TaxID=47854 RepID=UPI00368B14EF
MLAAEAPKITDWMQAWGSVVGLVMSTAAVIFTGLLFRHEIRVRREEQRDNEAAQARLLTANHHVQRGDGPPVLFWEVVNHSAAPITDLDVYISPASLDDSYLVERERVVEDKLLPPGKSIDGWKTLFPPFPQSDEGHYRIRMELDFVDSAGLSWRRLATFTPERQLGYVDPRSSALGLAWEYMWWLSRPTDWLVCRARDVRTRLLSHMKDRVLERQRRRRSPRPTTASRPAGGGPGRGAGRAAG